MYIFRIALTSYFVCSGWSSGLYELTCHQYQDWVLVYMLGSVVDIYNCRYLSALFQVSQSLPPTGRFPPTLCSRYHLVRMLWSFLLPLHPLFSLQCITHAIFQYTYAYVILTQNR